VLGVQPSFAECFLPNGRAPHAGEMFRSEAHARTLESIAETAGESFYRGDLARAMVADARRHGGAMTLEDLAAHSADWVGALSQAYAGAVVHELPPSGQGTATLIGLAILETSRAAAASTTRRRCIWPSGRRSCPWLTSRLMSPTTGATTVSAASPLDPAFLAGPARLIDRPAPAIQGRSVGIRSKKL
jgi:gamma-glutamyltranspeptidase/glutathione hydrolase